MPNFNVEEIKVTLRQHAVFSKFDSLILEEIARGDILELSKGQSLAADKTLKESDFFFVLEGVLEVFKTTRKETYLLDELKKGAIIGETPPFKSNFERNSIRSQDKTVLLIISERVINSLSKKNGQGAISLFEYLHEQALQFLEKINQSALLLIHQKKNMGHFIINLVVMLSLFSIALPYFQKWIQQKEVIFASAPLLFVAVIWLLLRLKLTKTPLSTVGITRKNLKQALLQSVALSVLLIGVLIALKALLIAFAPSWQGESLFHTYAERMRERQSVSARHMSALILLYPLSVFLQEVLARGALQGSFQQFFTWKYSHLLAIVLASFVFSCSFAHYGPQVVLGIFISGLFWGWWYSKIENIFGVSLSHALVGLTAILWIGWN